MSEHLALLRIARRDALRAKGRSALIVLMIMLPVFALSVVDVLARTAQPDPDEVVTRRLGATQYLLRAEAPIGAGYMQAPDPDEGGRSASSGPDPTRYADPAELVPAGGRVLTATSAEVDVRTRGGAALIGWEEVAAADPAFAGRYKVLAGRAPRNEAEVLATPELLERTGTRVGGILAVTDPAAEVTVVGTAQEVGTLGQETVFALPGTLVGRRGGIARSEVFGSLVYVANAPPLTWQQVLALNVQGVSAYDRDIVRHPPPRSRIPYYADGSGAGTSDEFISSVLIGRSPWSWPSWKWFSSRALRSPSAPEGRPVRWRCSPPPAARPDISARWCSQAGSCSARWPRWWVSPAGSSPPRSSGRCSSTMPTSRSQRFDVRPWSCSPLPQSPSSPGCSRRWSPRARPPTRTSSRHSPAGVMVFALEGDAISGIVGFADASLFERFGLPIELDE